MTPTYLIFGQLTREYLLTATGPARLDVPGGSPLYAAAGFRVWESGLGLVGRVGNDYPHEWPDVPGSFPILLVGALQSVTNGTNPWVACQASSGRVRRGSGRVLSVGLEGASCYSLLDKFSEARVNEKGRGLHGPRSEER